MLIDKVTEEIAHFIGLFQIAVESGRLRKDYQDFQIARQLAEDPASLDDTHVIFRPSYIFNEPEPGLRYVPPWTEIVRVTADSKVAHLPPSIPIPTGVMPLPLLGIEPVAAKLSSWAPMTIEPPDQIAVRIGQDNFLSDIDYVGVGGHGGLFHSASGATQMLALEMLLHDALKVAPFADLETPGSAEEIGAFVDKIAPLLAAAPEHLGEDADPGMVTDGFAVGDAVLHGIWVDGEIASQRPDMQDHLPEGSPLAKEEGEEAEPAGVD